MGRTIERLERYRAHAGFCFLLVLILGLSEASQLRQVLVNLLTNAVQAMGNEGLIEVEAHRVGDYDEMVVRDEGPGIAEERWEWVFEPLYTTKAKGTGLGLSISRQVVERHGGRLEVVARAGPGTAFRIRLPQCETALEPEEEAHGEGEHFGR